jgi:hypothetical protein
VKRSSIKRDPQKTREWQERSRRKAAENARKKPRKPLRRKAKKRKPYSGPLKTATDIEKANRRAFRLAAEEQRCCACCGKRIGAIGDDCYPIKFEAHHVIEKRYLKANCLPLFDTRNALLLCEWCHLGQTNRMRPLKLVVLTDANIDYAFYLLKGYADQYLRSHYEGDDPRLKRSLEEQEP